MKGGLFIETLSNAEVITKALSVLNKKDKTNQGNMMDYMKTHKEINF